MFRNFLTVLVVLNCLASLSHAHGLAPSNKMTQIYDRKGDVMVKVELEPNDVQFNQKNNMEISIIDFSKPGFIENKVLLEIRHRIDGEQSEKVYSSAYPNGFFSQRIEFSSGGMYELRLQIDSESPSKNDVFCFEFTLKDNKRFAFVTVAVTLIVFLIFVLIVVYCFRLRSLNQ